MVIHPIYPTTPTGSTHHAGVNKKHSCDQGCDARISVWRRELQAFVFVFEAANCIVVEKPEYANATYFFDMEEPLPVAAQVIHPMPSDPSLIWQQMHGP